MPGVSLAERVVAIKVDRGPGADGGRYAYGSGCRVAGRAVLTAAHVVANARQVWVRGSDLRPKSASVDPGLLGDPQAWDLAQSHPPDLALVMIDDEMDDVAPLPVGRVNRVHPSGVVDRVHSVGYPWFGEETVTDSDVRKQVPVSGELLLSQREDGLLDFQVTIAPPLPVAGSGVNSQWSGMSGAPVVASGRLLGVITDHARRYGDSTLAVIPLTAFDREPTRGGVENPAAWWDRLGVAPTALAVLPPAAEADYLGTLREDVKALRARMPQLVGREKELADIAAFATGNQPYMWLVGKAFAGKSALLYTLVTTAGLLPESVDVVSYFLVRRSRDADYNRFLQAVVPQLELLCGWEARDRTRDRFNMAWQHATAQARGDGRHVLLVVDGLDEDLRPPGVPSVASELPTITNESGHILVSSRPFPQIRNGLGTTHPLKHCPLWMLEPLVRVEDLADIAKAEIDDLIEEGGVALDVHGLLTAAAGPLAVLDLAALHTDPERPRAKDTTQIRSLVTAARSLETVGTPDCPRYRFAHQVLLDYAADQSDLADPEYRDRLHTWASRWAEDGWPEPRPDGSGTPRYLLDTYPDTLRGNSDHPALLPPEPAKLAALTGDFSWVEVAILELGVDAIIPWLRTADTPFGTQLAQCVTAQAGALRDRLRTDRGYVPRQLCLQALRYAMIDLADKARKRLISLPDPGPIPQSTTAVTQPPAIELGRHDAEVTVLGVVPDRRVVSGDSDGLVRLWHTGYPGAFTDLGRHHGPVSALAVLSDRQVVTGGGDGDHRVLLWDTDHPGVAIELGGHDAPVVAMVALSERRVVAADSDGRVAVWNSDHPGEPNELGTHIGWLTSAAALSDRQIVTVGDGRVRLWHTDQPDEPTELGTLDGPGAAVAALTARLFVTADRPGGGLMLWNADRPGERTVLGNAVGWTAAVVALSDRRIVTGGDVDGRVLLWDTDHPGDAIELGGHDGRVNAMAAMSDHEVITGGDDRRVRLWRTDHPSQAREVGFADWLMIAVAALSSSQVVTGGYDGQILLWNIDRAGPPTALGNHYGRVAAVAAQSDHQVVTADVHGEVILRDTDRRTATKLGPHYGPVWAVAALSDQQVVTGDYADGRVRLWRTDQPGEATQIGTHQGVRAVAALSDHEIVTGGLDDGRILLWRTDQPNKPTHVGTHPNVRAVAALSDHQVVTGDLEDDGRVLLWRTDAPGDPIQLGAHHKLRAASALSEHEVVTSDMEDDARILVWRTEAPGVPAYTIRDAAGGLTSVRRDHVGNLLLTVSPQGGLTVFTI